MKSKQLSMILSLGMGHKKIYASSLSLSTETQFDVVKARLMARFSNVAYEDPPSSLSRAFLNQSNLIEGANAHRSIESAVASDIIEVERFTDDFGVTITRPIEKKKNSVDTIPSADDMTLWEYSHVNACSPRPLNLMLSDCVSSPRASDEGFDVTNAMFQWVALASNEKTGAQFDAWKMTINQNTSIEKKPVNILVIAFRGTRLDTFIDLLTDIQLQQKMVSCSDFVCKLDDGISGNLPSSSSSQSNDTSVSNADEIMVHSGFLKAYSSIRPTLFQLISSSNHGIDKLWMTGHSLGGALATLAVVDVGSVMKSQSSITSTTLLGKSVISSIPRLGISSYVFGTPRVGNAALAGRLRKLQEPVVDKQQSHKSIVESYFRINTAGDAVVFLPRGKNVNRLGIDYVHAGVTVILPSLLLIKPKKEKISSSRQISAEHNINTQMMRLEEETIERINNYIFAFRQGDVAESEARTLQSHTENQLYKIRIYRNSDFPPDPLTEINPDYDGFFPVDPRIWASSSFQNFALGEVVRAFRVLRGGFNREHRIVNYEKVLCSVSQEDVVII
ncbi:hypothetical protein ACHAW6_015111 [Cyclotella cf. meneghiniana]